MSDAVRGERIFQITFDFDFIDAQTMCVCVCVKSVFVCACVCAIEDVCKYMPHRRGAFTGMNACPRCLFIIWKSVIFGCLLARCVSAL